MPPRDAVSEAGAGGLDPRIVDEAAEWLARLEGGPLDAAGERDLEAWRARSPEHERAWQAARELKALMGRVPKDIGAPVLGRRRVSRRTVLKSLAGLAVAAPAGWLAWRGSSWAEWTADYRTATGEQRAVDLPDGSRLLLNTATAVDGAFDHAERRLLLRTGEILVETAADPQRPSRPFVVETAHGRIRALGTRFSVREPAAPGGGRTWVGVLEGAVRVHPGQSEGGALVLPAGRQAAFDRRAAGAPEALAPSVTAWTRGQIVAERWRLGELTAELARYRHGVLRCDPAVADLRISGVFQVDATDRALGIIAETLPVEVSSLTRYWVTIGPRE